MHVLTLYPSPRAHDCVRRGLPPWDLAPTRNHVGIAVGQKARCQECGVLYVLDEGRFWRRLDGLVA